MCTVSHMLFSHNHFYCQWTWLELHAVFFACFLSCYLSIVEIHITGEGSGGAHLAPLVIHVPLQTSIDNICWTWIFPISSVIITQSKGLCPWDRILIVFTFISNQLNWIEMTRQVKCNAFSMFPRRPMMMDMEENMMTRIMKPMRTTTTTSRRGNIYTQLLDKRKRLCHLFSIFFQSPSATERFSVTSYHCGFT